MKKHFLLLIMAFMSITAWAADLGKGSMIVPTVYYGTSPAMDGTGIEVYNEANQLVTDAHYDFAGYFTDAACETAATAAAIQASAAGTKIYAKVTAKGTTYTGSLVGELEITKMELTLKGTPGSKDYGVTADGTIYTLGTAANSVTTSTGVDKTTDFTGKFTFTRASGSNIGKYDISATITDATLAKNYNVRSENIKIADGTAQAKYEIGKRTFSEANIEVTVSSAGLVYTGDALTPAITVTDKTMGALTLTTDYTVSYGDEHKTKGNHTVTITGAGNYTAGTISKTFTIAGAPLIVSPYYETTYNGATTALGAAVAGTATATETNKFNLQGWVDATAPALTWAVGEGAVWSSDNATVNAGSYHLDINPATTFTGADNYNIVLQQGTYKVTKKAITFTPANKTIEYGTPEVYALTDAWKATAIDADEAYLVKAVKITRAETAEATGANAGKYKLTASFKTDDEIDAEVDADASVVAANKAAEKQKIKTARDNYELTSGTGYATIENGTVIIALNESYAGYNGLKKVYDGQDVSVTLNKTDGISIIGGAENVDLTGLTLTVLDNDAVAGKATVGKYTLQLSGATPAANYNVTYVQSKYEITARPLTLTIFDQTLVKGNVPDLTSSTLYSIATGEGVGLASTDKASEVFALKLDNTASGTDDGSNKLTQSTDEATLGQITANPDEYVGGIIMTTTGCAKASNYSFVYDNDGDPETAMVAGYIKGTATVIATGALTLDDSKDLSQATEIPAGPADKNVTFSARSLNAEKWNVLVLPGSITVKALSDAFGYAVIDVLDTDASDGNIHFKLKVAGTIAANTPFLIYPSGVKNNLNQITLPLTGVKTPTATVEVADKAGNKFVGVYKATSIFGQDYRYLSAGTWYDARNFTEADPCPIKPLRAYLDLTGNAAAARALIYIDEPDGTTTAINAISGEVISKNAEGWYTIGGMKLQGAPTQKGIYINNGKKVVVR